MRPPVYGSADDDLTLWMSLLQANATLTGAVGERLRAASGLPLGWYEVLAHLSPAPDGRMRMQELAAAVLLSNSGLTRVCDRLEQAGYLVRQSCPTDRRGQFAVITPEGRARFDAAAPIFASVVRGMFAGHLNATERATLRRALGKVIAGNGGALRRPASMTQAPSKPAKRARAGTDSSG